ncbi:hypothetical protein [Taibaiella helva]|uniref:hypothetical protein n=1 Tax=Taibaiella helva TaxID=2301235 RepID=UPI000E56DCB1|nr:hypothetical protein [Taibaiella helva]
MKTRIYALIASTFIAGTAMAQTKIKDGTVGGSSTLPNNDAILELESTQRGFLLPRLPLQATNNPAPLTAHIAGMTVYNTATAGTAPANVSPGWYYNDGTRWVRLAVAFEGQTLSYGSGAPTGACSGTGLYTDTSMVSPTVGQQWTCSSGSWVAYTAPSQTEWTYWGSNNDAGGDKVAMIERKGHIAINNGNPRVYLKTDNATTWSNRVIDVSDGRFRFYKEGGPEGTQEFINILPNGNVGINSVAPGATLQVDGSLKFPSAGTPVAGKVLTTDNAGNATWQASTSFGNTKIAATGTYTCPFNGAAGGAGLATGLSITIPSAGWYYFETGLTLNTDCNDYWMYINTGSGTADIWRVYCGASVPVYIVPRDQGRMLFLNPGTYPILAGKTNGVVPAQCDAGNPSVYVLATKVQN